MHILNIIDFFLQIETGFSRINKLCTNLHNIILKEFILDLAYSTREAVAARKFNPQQKKQQVVHKFKCITLHFLRQNLRYQVMFKIS